MKRPVQSGEEMMSTTWLLQRKTNARLRFYAREGVRFPLALKPAAKSTKEKHMAAKKIGILGDGHVGSALARGWERAGYEVKAVGNDEKAQKDTATWGEIVV